MSMTSCFAPMSTLEVAASVAYSVGHGLVRLVVSVMGQTARFGLAACAAVPNAGAPRPAPRPRPRASASATTARRTDILMVFMIPSRESTGPDGPGAVEPPADGGIHRTTLSATP